MKSGRRFQVLVAASTSLATATLGMCSLWTTPVMPKLRNNETSIVISDNQISWMLSFSPLGFMLGSLMTRFLCDQLGRKSTLLLSGIPFAAGTIIAASANKAWMLYIMKLLWGFGTGMVSTVETIYIAEIAAKDIRGRLTVGTRFMFYFGGLVIMIVGAFASYDVINYSLLVMPFLYVSACSWIPESPYFYLMKGNDVKAKKELSRLHGKSEGLELELEDMTSHVKKEMRNSSTFIELLRGRRYRKSIILIVGLKFVQIMTGIQTIQQYLSVIMAESKTEISLPMMLIIFGAIKFVIGIMSSILTDRVGRRPLIIFSLLGSSISLATIGSYFFLLDVIKINHDTLRPFGILTFIGILATVLISTMGFIPSIAIIQGEVFPINVKAVAIVSLNIYGGILGSLVPKIFQKVKDAAGLCGVFWMYASLALIGAIFSFFVVPETKGKSLKEIQVMLQDDVNDAAEIKSLNTNNVKSDNDFTETKYDDSKL